MLTGSSEQQLELINAFHDLGAEDETGHALAVDHVALSNLDEDDHNDVVELADGVPRTFRLPAGDLRPRDRALRPGAQERLVADGQLAPRREGVRADRDRQDRQLPVRATWSPTPTRSPPRGSAGSTNCSRCRRTGALGLDGFNRLTDRQRMHLLFGVCSSPIWARRVLAGAPFRDVDALLDRADRVLAELPDAEIDAALDGHPRIGAKVDNAVVGPRAGWRRGCRRRRARRTGRKEPRVRGQVRLRLPGVRQRPVRRGTAGHPHRAAGQRSRDRTPRHAQRTGQDQPAAAGTAAERASRPSDRGRIDAA